jgi:hypothetical protein
MSSEKEKAVKNKREMRDESLEIAVEENGKSKYNITLPFSYDFVVSPVDGKGKGVPVSSITNQGTETIIETPGSISQWKLKITKPSDQSHLDPTGDNSEDGDDESGDRFDDWLRGNASGMDDKSRIYVRNAKRKIIFRKERE